MKLTKSLGFTFIGLIAAVALWGATPAQAESTAACRFYKLPCEKIDLITHQTFQTSTLSTSTPKILTNIVNVLCGQSTLLVSILGLGTPQETHISEILWTACHTESGSECTITNVKLGLLNILRTAVNLGTATISATEFRVKCGMILDCTYSGEGMVLHVLGASFSTNGELTAKKLTLQKTAGLLCPKEAFFDALYESVTAFYVGS